MSKVVIVSCDGVRLKLTCTAELLEQPLAQCIVEPFLGAFNKKKGTTFSTVQLAKVEVDGTAVTDLSLTGTTVIGTSESPSVVLHLPAGGGEVVDVSSSASDDPVAVAAVAMLEHDPAAESEAAREAAREALKTLRLAVKETPAATAAALTPRLIGVLAGFTRLSVASAEREWTAASAEAAVALNNLLAATVDTGKAGALLCASELGVLPRMIACFAGCADDATRLPLPRLRLLSPIVFHLSLLPAVNAHADELATAVRSALSWVACMLEVPGVLDEAVGAALAADLVRATFNLLRVKKPDAAGVAELVETIGTMLRSGEGVDGVAGAALIEMKKAALQLPVALPEEVGYAKLHGEWRRLCELLFPLVVAANAEHAGEDIANQCVLPMLTLQKFCDASTATQGAIKEYIFGEVAGMDKPITADGKRDPYAPAGTPDWDPNSPLGTEASLRMHLLKLLTSTCHTAKHVCGNMLFSVCGDNAHEFTHLCGLGSAAGTLSERGLFGQFQQEQ